MNNVKNLLSAFALVAAVASSAAAQSSEGAGPGGLGGGLGGNVAPLGVPGSNFALRASTLGLRMQVTLAAGMPAQNPAGGVVNVPQGVAQLIGAALAGSATAAQQQALSDALGAGAAGSALVRALAAIDDTPAGLANAVNAFNAAIDAIPAGASPSAAMLGVRQALAILSQASATS